MKESIIRKPLLTEIEAVIKIWLDGNIQTHPFIQPDYWLNHIEYMRQVLPMSEVYVCEVEGEIAGFIGLDGDYIAGLFVSKAYQSQGVGRRLVEFIKQLHPTLTLAVYKQNERAMQFYAKLNFVVVEERIDANTNEVELLMRWNSACPIL
jgi:ribosomal protein S18 acetylase RimI-like enzyme